MSDEIERWTIERWHEEGKPANQPFHMRHNPGAIPLTNKDLATGKCRLLDVETKRFIEAVKMTCKLYGAVLFDPPGIHKASHDIVNVDRIWPGVYSVTATEEKRVLVSYVGWMMVNVPENGDGGA